jgi:hypothetical protein
MTTQWEYSLTDADEAMCVLIGVERQRPYFDSPESNRNYSMGNIDETYQHIITVGSELAYARMLGLTDFVPHVNKWRSESDVAGFEVRYSFPSDSYEPSLRLHERDEDYHPYVLLSEGAAVRTRRNTKNGFNPSHPYKALGWCYPAEVRLEHYQEQLGGWRIPIHALRPMSELDGTVGNWTVDSVL